MRNESGYTPTGDLVLVFPMPIPEFSAGGIALTPDTRERYMRATRIGTLVDAGPLAWENPRLHGLKPGDQILIPRYAADFLIVDGKEYCILRADAVMGKAEKVPDNMDLGRQVAKSSVEAFPQNDAPRIALPQ